MIVTKYIPFYNNERRAEGEEPLIDTGEPLPSHLDVDALAKGFVENLDVMLEI